MLHGKRHALLSFAFSLNCPILFDDAERSRHVWVIRKASKRRPTEPASRIFTWLSDIARLALGRGRQVVSKNSAAAARYLNLMQNMCSMIAEYETQSCPRMPSLRVAVRAGRIQAERGHLCETEKRNYLVCPKEAIVLLQGCLFVSVNTNPEMARRP